MKKCDKKFDELCDKTSDLENTIQELKSITAEIRRKQMSQIPEKVIARR